MRTIGRKRSTECDEFVILGHGFLKKWVTHETEDAAPEAVLGRANGHSMTMANLWYALRTLTGANRRARSAAQLLDDVVDAQLESLPQMSPNARRRSAEHLAQLVMLAQDYRYFAAGWISDRELRSRANATLTRIELIRTRPVEQLVE